MQAEKTSELAQVSQHKREFIIGLWKMSRVLSKRQKQKGNVFVTSVLMMWARRTHISGRGQSVMGWKYTVGLEKGK